MLRLLAGSPLGVGQSDRNLVALAELDERLQSRSEDGFGHLERAFANAQLFDCISLANLPQICGRLHICSFALWHVCKARSDKSSLRLAQMAAVDVQVDDDGQVKSTGGVCLDDGKYRQMTFRMDTGKPKNQAIDWLRRKLCSLDGGTGV